jgi:hypothetical protein
MADNLNIRRVPSIFGQHAEENLRRMTEEMSRIDSVDRRRFNQLVGEAAVLLPAEID